MKQAVIISTVYKDKNLALEVDQDLATIRKQKKYDSFHELNLPPLQSSKKLAKSLLTEFEQNTLNLLHNQPVIDIYLNTHGTPGAFDIDLNFITQVISTISHHQTKIAGMYALLCDGFTPQLPQHQKERHAMQSQDKLYKTKPSVLEKLARRISGLKTPYQQAFDLWGVNCPYDPVRDKSLVDALLSGDQSDKRVQHLKAETKLATPHIHFTESDFNRLCSLDKSNKEYSLLAEAQAGLFKEMKNKIIHSEQLTERSTRLLASVSQNHKETFVNDFKIWNKKHKPTSKTKRGILFGF